MQEEADVKYMANYNRDKQGSSLTVEKAVAAIQAFFTNMQDMRRTNCKTKTLMLTRKNKKFKDSDDERDEDEDDEDEREDDVVSMTLVGGSTHMIARSMSIGGSTL